MKFIILIFLLFEIKINAKLYIESYIPNENELGSVTIANKGKDYNLKKGDVLKTYRYSDIYSRWVYTGKVKVVLTNPNIYSKIIEGSGYKNNRLMCGDLAIKYSVNVSNIYISQEKAILYKNLFKHFEIFPKNYSISEIGKMKLNEIINIFTENKFNSITVKVYNNYYDKILSLIDTVQRAITIKEFLTEKLPNIKIKTMGLGNFNNETKLAYIMINFN